MSSFEIKINLDKKCKRCHRGGPGPGGYCLSCIADMVASGEIDILKAKLKEK